MFEAFSHRNFARFQAARVLAVIATQTQGVAIAWQIYAMTRDTLAIAWIGLAQFVPAFLLVFITGATADRFSRKKILVLTHTVYVACSLALAWMSATGRLSPSLVYAILAISGTARAFAGPAGSALMPSLVPTEDLRSAMSWSSMLWQVATIIGPSLGGLLQLTPYGSTAAYAGAAILGLAALSMQVSLQITHLPRQTHESMWVRLTGGVRYIRANPLLLGAISLDLFAVLLGGAVALIPVFAHDILHVTEGWNGLLRAAPSIGACGMAIALARFPLERRAGWTMLWSVAGFGAATVVFGLSKSVWLSFSALIAIGAFDMVSVVVRQTLLQLRTPDAMRGRVSAVNQVFVGASNELGEFESGVTAKWLNPFNAVIAGGLGTLLIVAIWSRIFPTLRDADQLVLAETNPEERSQDKP